MPRPSPGLVFGVYPFAVTGTVSGIATGPPDDLRRLPPIIDDLRGQNEFLLRNYGRFFDESSIPTVLSQIEFCMYSGLPWDFALCFADDNNLDGWLKLIRETIETYGTKLHTLQITNEPNLHHPPGDGVYANVLEAAAPRRHHCKANRASMQCDDPDRLQRSPGRCT